MTQTPDPHPWRLLGLADVDERVYRGLLDTDEAVDDVAAALGISATRAHESVHRLEAAGLVAREEGSRRHLPTAPETAIDRLIAEVQAELAAARVTATRLQTQYDARTAASGAGELVEVVAGESQIVARFSQLMASATDEVMAFVAPPFLAPGDYEQDEHAQLAAGVTYRVVYEPAGVEAQGGPDAVLESVSEGEQARVTPELPVKMFIVDRHSALVPLHLEVGPAAVVVNRFGLVDALVALFEQVWTAAWPLADYEGATPVDPWSEADRRLIGLLRTGETDAAIARALGVTPRTVGRRLATLKAQTGASTRFQLGWRLAELESQQG